MRCISSFGSQVDSKKLTGNVGREADMVGDSMRNNYIDYICLL